MLVRLPRCLALLEFQDITCGTCGFLRLSTNWHTQALFYRTDGTRSFKFLTQALNSVCLFIAYVHLQTFWETHKNWKNLPHALDVYFKVIKCSKHEEDCANFCVLFRKSELYIYISKKCLRIFFIPKCPRLVRQGLDLQNSGCAKNIHLRKICVISENVFHIVRSYK